MDILNSVVTFFSQTAPFLFPVIALVAALLNIANSVWIGRAREAMKKAEELRLQTVAVNLSMTKSIVDYTDLKEQLTKERDAVLALKSKISAREQFANWDELLEVLLGAEKNAEELKRVSEKAKEPPEMLNRSRYELEEAIADTRRMVDELSKYNFPAAKLMRVYARYIGNTVDRTEKKVVI